MAAKRKSGRTQPHAERIRPAVAVRLDREAVAAIDALAAARGVNRSRILADAIAVVLAHPDVLEEQATTAA